MMFSNIDLVALLAVADAGSVRGAASALNRTQPSVTQAIRRLEDAVGFPLLDRSSYRARLTDGGEVFVARARLLVQHVENLCAFAALLSDGVEPRLRLGIDCAIPRETWVKLLIGMTETFPHTEIEVEYGEGIRLLPRLIEGKLDLAILFHISVHQTCSLELESKVLGEAEFCNVVKTDKIDCLTESIASIPQILVVDFENSFAAPGAIEKQRHWRVNTHQMQADLILEGLGWGSVPKEMIRKELECGIISSLDYQGLKARSLHPFSLYRRRKAVAGPAAAFVWQSAVSLADIAD